MLSAKTPGRQRTNISGGRDGFTLIEIVMVVVVLGILAAIVVPGMSGLSDSTRINVTKSEMLMLKRAIIGSSSITSGGRYLDLGFEGQVGRPPADLTELAVKPDSVMAYDSYTRIGWNGPYIDTANGDYLFDAWGEAYVYDPVERTILSCGGPDTIKISF